MKSTTLLKALAAPLFALATLPAVAQANTLEIAAGGGLASFHSGGSTSNKGLFQGSAAYDFVNSFGIGFEYAYSPIASATDNEFGYNATGTAHLDHFGGVARIGFLPSSRVDPFVLISGGGVREKATLKLTGNGVNQSTSDSETGSYVGFGGGASLWLGGNWGVRPELRYERLRIGGNLNELDVTGSLFYRFAGHHRG